jgi:hypothetical protein
MLSRSDQESAYIMLSYALTGKGLFSQAPDRHNTVPFPEHGLPNGEEDK